MKRWYVVQVYAGQEETVKADLLKRIHEQGLDDMFGQVLIPSAKQKQLFATEPVKDQQLFPGYVLVEMEMIPQAQKLVDSSLRVLRFLGGKDPVPITQKEVNRIISQVKGEISVGTEKELFISGQEIEIQDGPFAGFVGIIEDVDKENERLTVMVSIFGRMTPVEIGFHQVKR